MMINESEFLNQKKMIVASVTHQNIGGKEILIEGEVDCGDILMGTVTGNWACKNFMERREADTGLCLKQLTFYYGKVGGLGYIVASDELE